jgi:hypothetical protein
MLADDGDLGYVDQVDVDPEVHACLRSGFAATGCSIRRCGSR